MGFFDRLRGRSVQAVRNSPVVAATVRRGEAMVQQYAAMDPEKAALAELAGQQEAWIASDRIATICSGCKLRLYRPARTTGVKRRGKMLATKAADYTDLGEVEEIRNHPLLDLLRKPNPWYTGNQFDRYRFQSQLMTGEAFAYKHTTDSGLPVFLFPLSSPYVRPIPSKESLVSHFVYGRESDATVDLLPEQVVRWVYAYDLHRPWMAYGPTRAIWRELRTLLYGASAELARWENGAFPSNAIMVDEQATDAEVDAIKALIEGKYGGVENLGRTMVLRGAVDVKALDFEPDKVMYAEGMTFAQELVWRAYGIPATIMRLDDANLASSVTGHRQFMEQTIEPLLIRDADAINEQLVPGYGEDIFVAYDSPVPQDEATVVARAQLIGRGISLNEWRAEAGYDASDTEGADDPMAEMLSAQPEPVSPFPFPMPRAVEARSIAKAMLRDRDAACCDGHHTKSLDPDNPDIPDEQVRISRDIATAMERWYRDTLGPEVLRAGVNFNASQESVSALARELEPIFLRLWDAGVGEAFANIGADGDTIVDDPAVRQFMRGYLEDLSTGIARTDAERIRSALEVGLDSGASIQEMRDAIVDEYAGNISRSRAETIARTESSYVTNEAHRQTMKAYGFTTKRWLIAPGHCPLCATLVAQQGGFVPIDEPFYPQGTTIIGTDGRSYTTNRNVQAPPLHPRCRCTLVYGED